MKGIVTSLLLLPSLFSCTYLKYASIQAEYTRLQKADPGQRNLKHMIDRETYFVVGRTIDAEARYAESHLAVAAYSDRYKPNERVDTMLVAGAGTHFGLNLPEGEYRLLVFADIDSNRLFGATEVIGQTAISLDQATTPDKVLEQVEIRLSAPRRVAWAAAFARPDVPEPQSSFFFPAGTIRSLDDPIFSDNMATLGMYDPASFLEKAPTMFYALEEDLAYKIPVVFVHGIGGSARNFKPIVDRLDRQRFKPWFFHYPSGGDLDQLADLFYRIFLSGKVADLDDMPIIIIAHSMGGLIVREALNRRENDRNENKIGLVVTIATPFGGHPAAASGEAHGLIVLPSWRDLNPDNRFIKELFRKPLPKVAEHVLVYAFKNPEGLNDNGNSDGVVPLSSQLRPQAQQEATYQMGFESTHVGVLSNEDMIAQMFARMNDVKNFYPESHLRVWRQGGYSLELSDDYNPLSQYVIHSMGRYWMAISNGTLEPFFPEQERFVRMVKGKEPARDQVVKDWIRFLHDYPDIDRSGRLAP